MTGPGPLTRKVIEYQEVMKRLVPTAHSPQDWDPLAQLVAVDEFERVGTFREVHNWPQYVEMLCQWAGSIGTFDERHRSACIQWRSRRTLITRGTLYRSPSRRLR